MKYTHLKLNEEVTFLSGYYVPVKEVRLKHGGGEALYVVGQAVIESSCCGARSFGYATVPGYIIQWQRETNANGLPVSEVAQIEDRSTRQEISQMIEAAEHITQIEFW